MADIRLVLGDITLISADAIVNAANAGLLGGGGVDGAIHAAAGPSVMEECRSLMHGRPNLEPGEVVRTGAGDLPATHILHTVGPIWGDDAPDVQDGQLADCYRNSLKMASELGCRTIAFPNISTGVYGFPKDRAARIAVETISGTAPDTIETVYLVCFGPDNEAAVRAALEQT